MQGEVEFVPRVFAAGRNDVSDFLHTLACYHHLAGS